MWPRALTALREWWSRRGPGPGAGVSTSARASAEALEPRLLYSADPLGLYAAVDDVGGISPDLRGHGALSGPPAQEVHHAEATPSLRPLAAQEVSVLVAVDLRVREADSLLADLRAQALASGQRIDLIWLDSERDGLTQITQALQRQGGAVSAVHLIGHAQPGQLVLGNRVFDAQALDAQQALLAGWADHLTPDADILLWGCDAGADASGQALIQTLARWTQADVAASLDRSGHSSLGGDWALEVSTGPIEAAAPFSAGWMAGWQHSLATFVVTNTGNSGAGSFRQALIDANNSPGLDSIVFNIAGTGAHVISLTTPLPQITDPVLIDATTDDSFAANGNRPAIVLDGNNVVSDGLVLTPDTSGSTIRGLVVRDFGFWGIWVMSGSNGNTISGNWFGAMDAAGNAVAGEENAIGLWIESSQNVVEGNVISGNAQHGLVLSGADAIGNLVRGNWIGVAPDGRTALRNVDAGVSIEDDAAQNLIGGTAAGQGNVIAFNRAGIVLGEGGAGPPVDNAILSNRIFGNDELGISLLLSTDVTPNDPGDADGGINDLQNFPTITLAENGVAGLNVGGQLNSQPNSSYRIEVFVSRPDEVDASGHGEGARLLGAVEISTDPTGNANWSLALPNLWVNAGDGISATATEVISPGVYGSTSEFSATVAATRVAGVVVVDSTTDVDDGDTTSIAALQADRGADGVISLREALAATNNSPNGATPDRIVFAIPREDDAFQANRGVFRISVASALPVITEGVIIDGRSQSLAWGNTNNRLLGTGGTVGADALTLSRVEAPEIELLDVGNVDHLIELDTTATASEVRGLAMLGSGVSDLWIKANDVVVEGNVLGIRADSLSDPGGAERSAGSLVRISDADNGVFRNNLLAYSGLHGLENNNVNTDGWLIENNEIAHVAQLSASMDVLFFQGTNTVIRGNLLRDSNASGVDFTNNAVGLSFVNNTVTGLNGSEGHAVAVWLGATSVFIGSNVITGNPGGGLVIDSGNNVMSRNLVYNNGGLAEIDIGRDGVTANDGGDSDAGPNGRQNFPTLTSVSTDNAGNVAVSGELISQANSHYRLEFFATPTGDTTGHGGAQRYLGNLDVSTDGSGVVAFGTVLAANLAPGERVMATATLGNASFTVFQATSELGPNTTTTVTGQGLIYVNTTSDVADGDATTLNTLLLDPGADGMISLREAMIAANNTPNDGAGPDRIRFNIAGTGTHVINVLSALPVITDRVELDATTDDSFAANSNRPAIVLDGNDITASGVVVGSGGGGLITGLLVRNFGQAGIELQVGSLPTRVVGNYVGALGTDGEAAATTLRNGTSGIRVAGSNHTIGEAGNGNVVSGNGADGIFVLGNSNVVRANLTGTNASGYAAVPNGEAGIAVLNGSNNLIGHSNGFGNLSSGNTLDGIKVYGASAANNVVVGNRVGLNRDASAAMPNQTQGVWVAQGADNNRIGGTAAGEGNEIAGNTFAGVQLADPGTTGNRVEGNWIGVTAGGAAFANNSGIEIINGASGNLVGGVANGAGNVIAENTLNGVLVDDASTQDNAILRNSIRDNGEQGIALSTDGPTLNDSDDGDSGPNGFGNFPVLSWVRSGTDTRVVGTFQGAAAQALRLEFFSAPVQDNGGFGEGAVFVGAVTVTTDGSGAASFDHVFNAVAVPAGHVLTATATPDLGGGLWGGTSEFSRAATVLSDSTAALISVTTAADTADGNTMSLSTLLADPGADGLISLREALIAANNTPNASGGPDRIHFSIAGTAPHVITLASALPAITDAVVIDASTDNSFSANGNRPAVTLDGEGVASPGLLLADGADGSTIRGLIIRDFDGAGIEAAAGSDGHTIVGNWIGRLSDGGVDIGAAEANTGAAIRLLSSNHTIGGGTAADRNVLAGNSGGGVLIINGSANQILGNFIGTDATGNALLDTGHGVVLQGTASNNQIGGTAAGQGNVIVVNGGGGIRVEGGDADGTVIQGNHIGVNAAGTAQLGTGGPIFIVNGADNTLIGGTTAGAGNWIAGNGGWIGIEVDGGSAGTVIQGNRIGTDATGTANWGFSQHAILFENGVTSALVGGTVAGAGNIISGGGVGTFDGIRVFSTASGVAILGNRIYGNDGLGIDLDFGDVTANDAGDTDTGGNNQQNFPVLSLARTDETSQFTVQGTLSSAVNSFYRIEFFANPSPDNTGHGEGQTFLGFVNVSTDPFGDASFNTTLTATVPAGQFISATATRSDASFSTFTDTSEFSRNVVALSSLQATVTVTTDADTEDGDTTNLAILMANPGGDGLISLREAIIAANNTANGSGGPDRIAFGIPGTGPHTIALGSLLPQIIDGVEIDASTDDSYAANGFRPAIVIDGNDLVGDGLVLANSASGSVVRGLLIRDFAGAGLRVDANNSLIVGNYLGSLLPSGLDAGSTESLSGEGIFINGSDNVVGGTGAAERNVIAGVNQQGIEIFGSRNTVVGNWVGLAGDGVSALGTRLAGLLINPGADDNLIGGTVPGAGNVFANSVDARGINLVGAVRNAFLGNLTYNNFALGIDLNGDDVTPNDPGDADTGPNDYQNFPVLVSAESGAGTTTITGSLNSQSGASFRLEFFSAPTSDPSGHGEATTYLGHTTVITNGSGDATFSVVLPGVTVTAGHVVTATATRDLGGGQFGGTSEYAANVTATAAQGVNGTVFEDVDGDGQVLDDGVGMANATVRLYRDDGDGTPDNDDSLVATAVTDLSGFYSFGNQTDATYWVVVDSRTLSPTTGLRAGFSASDTWAEQTYGAAGSARFSGGSYSFLSSDGAQYGGLQTQRADDASTLSGAEHIHRAVVAGAGVSNADFGFSFQVISHTRDGDDDLSANRSAQGSLRQFIQNSNALTNTLSSVFRIPGTDAGVSGGVAVITLGSELPTVQRTVTLDATTQTAWGGDTNAGTLGTGGTVGADAQTLAAVQRPEVEVRGVAGTGSVLTLQGFNSVLRGFALVGGGTAGQDTTATLRVSGGGSLVQGNVIGTGASALADPGAAQRSQALGVYLTGQTSFTGNLVAYSSRHGMVLDPGASGSTVTANEVAFSALTDATYAGIVWAAVGGGGMTGNLVRDSSGNGVELFGGASNLLVQGNSILNSADAGVEIGTASNGNSLLSNLISNSVGHGISMLDNQGNTIGLAGQGNQIIVNGLNGILLNNTQGTVIQGNAIGTDLVGGSVAGNGGNGIDLTGNARGTLIGGTGAGDGNLIRHNGGDGVSMDNSAGAGNAVLGNSVNANARLGIDLNDDDLVNDNDSNDDDVGPNGMQNHPELYLSALTPTALELTGDLRAAPNQTYRIEFFANSAADPSGFGEGRSYLGAEEVTTDASGYGSVSSTLPIGSVTAGQLISATATRMGGVGVYLDTSEFSRVVSVLAATRNTVVVTTDSDVEDGDTSTLSTLLGNPGADGLISLREALSAANDTPNGSDGPDRIQFAIPGTGAHVITLGSDLPLITDAVEIDARSDDSFAANGNRPAIVIDGAGNVNDLLVFSGGSADSALRGVVLRNAIETLLRLQQAADNIVVQGNYIGSLTPTGQALNGAVSAQGIWIEAANARIGGTAPGEGNVISGNNYAAVVLTRPTATGNRIEGNLIGLEADGTTLLRNVEFGVVAFDGATGNVLGGTAAGAGNRIEGADIGVLVDSNTLDAQLSILGNRISRSAALGIDLWPGEGVTANDPGDGDLGGNGLQNRPVLTQATAGAGTVTVSGTLASAASSSYRIEFFLNTAAEAHPSGYGEGGQYLGAVEVLTDAGGNASFTSPALAATMQPGDVVSATATQILAPGVFGATSEFSAQATAGQPVLSVSVPGPQMLAEDGGLVFSAAQGTAIAVSDGSAADSAVQVQLTVARGALTLFRTTGLTSVNGLGTAQVTLSGPESAINAALDGLRFDAGANVTGADSLQVVLTGPSAAQQSATVALTITPVNDAPVLVAGEGPRVYAEGAAPVALDTLITLNDVDTANLAGGQLQVGVVTNAWVGDLLDVRHQGTGPGQVGVQGLQVSFSGVTIGQITGTGSTLTVSFNAQASLAAVQAVLRQVVFSTTDDPLVAPRTIAIEVTDGQGGTSNRVQQTVSVSADHSLRVNTPLDTLDGDTSSVSALLNNRGADGAISLREALLALNATGGSTPGVRNTITFGIPGTGVHTLNLSSALPAITRPITVDGRTDDSYAANGNRPAIVLNGAGALATGLDFAAGSQGSQLTGLHLQGFDTAVRVQTPVQDVALTGNLFTASRLMAIDLNGDGPTANDARDADGGANQGQNTPVVLHANSHSGQTTVVGTVESTANTRLLLSVYVSPLAVANGTGQAQRSLGEFWVTTDASGLASFVQSFSGATLSPGERVSMMATRDLGAGLLGSSSELSLAVLGTQDAPGFAVSTSGLTTRETGTTAGFSLALTAPPTADVTIQWTSSDPGEGQPLVSTLVFTPFDWNVAQRVDVRGAGDAALDGDRVYGLLGTVISADAAYHNRPLSSPNFTNVDVNRAAVLVSPPMLGGEFLVNTHTPDVQGFASRGGQTIAVGPQGQAVAVWSSQAQDGSGWGVYGQRFDVDGRPLGVEFRVSDFTLLNQMGPSVAFAADGGFVVAWESQLGVNTEVMARRYSAQGVPGAQFRVNQALIGAEQNVQVGIDAQGRMLFVWQRQVLLGDADIMARRFDASGAPLSPEFILNRTTAGTQSVPRLAMNASGQAVVVWSSSTADGSGLGVVAQRIGANGQLVGPEILVNQTSLGDQNSATVAIDANGAFAVGWRSAASGDEAPTNALVRAFAADGTPLAAEAVVSNTVNQAQERPWLTAVSGGWLATWAGDRQDGDGYGVFARRLATDGRPVASEFRVSESTAGEQSAPRAAVSPNGVAWVMWEGSGAGDSQGVFARRFALADTLPEGGAVSLEVVLAARPDTDVVVPLRFGADSGAQPFVGVPLPSLTFTPQNWNRPQTVTLAVARDGIVTGDTPVRLETGPAQSNDPRWNGLQSDSVRLTRLEADTRSQITVNTTASVADGDTTNLGSLLLNPGADGRISLREALLASQNSAPGPGGPNRIVFDIPEALDARGNHVITLDTALPVLTQPVELDASTEPDAVRAGRPVVLIRSTGTVGGGPADGLVVGTGASGSRVQGLIWEALPGTAVRLLEGTTDVRIDGNLFEANRVAIHVEGAAGGPNTANSWTGNRVLGQTVAGILLGPSPNLLNDPMDADSGPNGLQNHPIIERAVWNGSTLAVSGELLSAPLTSYRIDLFLTAAAAASPSGLGQGDRLVHSAVYTTDALGRVRFDLANLAMTGVALGDVLSAIATAQATGTTPAASSAFSPNRVITSPNTAPQIAVPPAQGLDEDSELLITGLRIDDVDANVGSVSLSVSAGTLTIDVSGGARLLAGAQGAAALSLQGTQSQLNAALATLRYRGAADASGGDSLRLVATDAAGAVAEARVAIEIRPVNDAPSFPSGAAVSLSAPENSLPTVTIIANDIDALPGTLVYSLAGGDDVALFDINPQSGQLSLRATPDHESPADANRDNVYQVTVRVTDAAGASADQAVNLRISNVNEAPRVEAPDVWNIPAGVRPGSVVGAVQGSDVDANDTVRYALVDSAEGRFVIDAETGVVRISETASFAFSGERSYTLVVQVTDAAGLTQSKSLTVRVLGLPPDPGTGGAPGVPGLPPAVPPGLPPAPSPTPAPSPVSTPPAPPAPSQPPAESPGDPPPDGGSPADPPPPAAAEGPGGGDLPLGLGRRVGNGLGGIGGAWTPDTETRDLFSGLIEGALRDVAERGSRLQAGFSAETFMPSGGAGAAATGAVLFGASPMELTRALLQEGLEMRSDSGEALSSMLGKLWMVGAREGADAADAAAQAGLVARTDDTRQTAEEWLIEITQPEKVVGVSLTAGLVWWVTRGGGVIASALMGVPAWRQVDLLPVMMAAQDKDDDEPDTDGDDKRAAAPAAGVSSNASDGAGTASSPGWDAAAAEDLFARRAPKARPAPVWQ